MDIATGEVAFFWMSILFCDVRISYISTFPTFLLCLPLQNSVFHKIQPYKKEELQGQMLFTDDCLSGPGYIQLPEISALSGFRWLLDLAWNA